MGRALGAREAGQDGRRDVPGRGRRRDPRAVDRLHQPGAVDARPGHGAPRAGTRRIRRGAGSLCHHRHLRLCRPAAARHHLGREERHRDQQRAPHLARAPGRAGARRGAQRLVDSGGLRAPARRGRSWVRAFPAPPVSVRRPPKSVWNEHRESTRGRDLDITGLSYVMLETTGPQQWPLKEGESTGRVRLYEDGVFPTTDGRARFVDTAYKPVAEAREARYPFSLNTGRLRDQWHGMSRTGTVGPPVRPCV